MNASANAVRIYRDAEDNFRIETSCIDLDAFWGRYSQALAKAMLRDGTTEELADGERPAHIANVLNRSAFLIALKLAGYKADNVNETRVLSHGYLSPGDGTLFVEEDGAEFRAKYLKPAVAAT